MQEEDEENLKSIERNTTCICSTVSISYLCLPLHRAAGEGRTWYEPEH